MATLHMDTDTTTYEPTGFADTIFKQRYAISKTETWAEACRRVANHVSACEINGNRDKWSERYTKIIQDNKFIPGGRIWYGSGRAKGQLLNCFVVPAADSREGWGKTVSDMLIISGTGGGVGINFSPIRPRGTPINGTGGEATGAVSLMEVINQTGEVIKAGGGRRTALMLCLDYDHFDVKEFLTKKFNTVHMEAGDLESIKTSIQESFPYIPAEEVKSMTKALKENDVQFTEEVVEKFVYPLIKHQKDQILKNANISVLVDQQFFDLVESDGDIVFSYRGKELDTMKARDMWNTLVHNAWESGEPGILNRGLANEMNNIWYHKPLISTNPCGEIWLEAYGCCDLGAINLSQHIDPATQDFNWDALAESVTTGVRFLDSVLSVNHYPLPEIERNCNEVRRIGLGVMGLGHALVQLGLRYDRSEGRKKVDQLFNFIKKRAYEASTYLAAEKGAFPAFDGEKFLESGFCKTLPKNIRAKIAEYGIRNCALLTIAPTGTTSILAATSSGIEPIFAPGYKRRYYTNSSNSNERVLQEEIVIDPLFDTLYQQKVDMASFVSAHEVNVENHLKIQSICQKHIDNAVSKTINLPNDYSVEDFADLLLKYAPGLKGTTVYRSGSRGNEPLTPLTVEEAMNQLSGQDFGIGTINSDCPSGVCEIPAFKAEPQQIES